MALKSTKSFARGAFEQDFAGRDYCHPRAEFPNIINDMC